MDFQTTIYPIQDAPNGTGWILLEEEGRYHQKLIQIDIIEIEHTL